MCTAMSHQTPKAQASRETACRYGVIAAHRGTPSSLATMSASRPISVTRPVRSRHSSTASALYISETRPVTIATWSNVAVPVVAMGTAILRTDYAPPLMLHQLCNVESGRLSRVEAHDEELTVDQLAAKVGMTVRNVRAYAGRGLIPPPRLVGRTGYYGTDHVARLTLVRELLGKGYTLAAVERMMSELPDGALALGVFETLVTPWTPSEPEVLDEHQLAERAGVPHDPAVIAQL